MKNKKNHNHNHNQMFYSQSSGDEKLVIESNLHLYIINSGQKTSYYRNNLLQRNSILEEDIMCTLANALMS